MSTLTTGLRFALGETLDMLRDKMIEELGLSVAKTA